MNGSLALVLGGGGARGAYQAGVLRGIARRFPELTFPILFGISAGAVNTIHLAAHQGTALQSADDLAALWLALTPDRVFDVSARRLLGNTFSWARRLMSGGSAKQSERQGGMVDTDPLRRFLGQALDRDAEGGLPGIARNIERGRLKSVALAATSYTTGQSVTWVEGRDIDCWQRPQRRTETARLTIEHVMASSALPMLFPAVKVGTEWFGDGGVRLTAPLSPALHLGASRMLTISTRYQRSEIEARAHATTAYPPPAQVLGVLYNAIFLDLIDEDILRLRRVNDLLERLPVEQRGSMRIVDILVLRPSQDLGKLAAQFEPKLPGMLRYLTRGLGTRKTTSLDFISLILFQADYIKRLIELGEEDAERQRTTIDAFLEA